ncbi:hypothetical protein PUN28_011114 [Cardiocondyla obscurior]|uniref:Uncharacterized protein n=1 Tax=Cardiocondyla obscurior TaxID=286306 RepID=A0AAW2FJA1_9HYME
MYIFVTGDGQQYSSFRHISAHCRPYRFLKFLMCIVHLCTTIQYSRFNFILNKIPITRLLENLLYSSEEKKEKKNTENI